MRRVIIVGAGGRDFHDFNVVFRSNRDTDVVAFAAAETPGIHSRRYPASLAGPLYPDGIPIYPEEELPGLIREHEVDEVVLAYSDLSHEDVMHRASVVLAAGASFSLLGPNATMLSSDKPVIGVGAVRTGAGKSQTSRRIGQILLERGLRVALVRHPMPYGDLETMRVQRFASQADIDASSPTIEEREEYERPVELGMLVYAGVDYEAILDQAEQEADVIIWDGGNNDFPFFRPDLFLVVTDPLRPAHELRYHPGEANLRMADVVVVNKIDSATPAQVDRVLADITAVNPAATIVRAESPVELSPGPTLVGTSVLAVDDGSTITRGQMPFGAGGVAARNAGADELIDPRPWAVGSIREVFERYRHIGNVLPAMGYGDEQLRELEATINAIPCDVVITGTPVDLGRLISVRHPIRHATYELRELGRPNLEDVVKPILEQARLKEGLVLV
ncbi:MAG TPA: cyclic 2,3-diphosphoglycerate synthase [Gaiellaceae bacterium]|jgi:predicted GTPase|nr:cyclic 2,3-diphosphoglycerate synthase [Gaiellaceae bacterium]